MSAIEELQVENWKIEQFQLLGLSSYEANQAVDDSIDYHEVEQLVKRGCPVLTALRIVA